VGPSGVSAASSVSKRQHALYAGPVQDLIDELGRMPGVGPKSAQRIAFHLLKLSRDDALRLAHAITEVKDRVAFCERCFNVSEGPLCGICTDERRDAQVLCVVEEPRDIVAVEKTHEFKGRYHVLQGAISPIEGIGPDQLKVKELLARLDPEGVTEVILCTNPNIEGEATAMYLARLLKPLGITVTRIASGLPVGGDLEYADELTLGRALEGRRAVD
jgi:recombination protein RecR